ncbi:MAG TPA: DUF5667 domain-containing protein [Candidatus Paceibacterota bacterium]|nr:DUF5667 domain-containing protein [Candidatus Paceibacterota bacterium]
MKKALITVFAVAIVFAPAYGFGQTSIATSTDPGLTPDSPFYFLKVWKEQIQTFFKFGAENKARQYLHLSEIRLAEYERMIEKGKTEIAERTLEKYNKQLSRALDKIEELKEKKKDVGEFVDDLKEVSSKHLEVLERNFEKVPEVAKYGIERALDSVKKQIEEAKELEDEIDELGDDMDEDLDEDVDGNIVSENRSKERENVELKSQNNSGESGTATLTEVGGNLKISLNLTGAPTGINQPAHIHSGNCAEIGGVKYALKFPVNGVSETLFEGMSLSDLKAEEPLAINVHKSTAEPGMYVACGDLEL